MRSTTRCKNNGCPHVGTTTTRHAHIPVTTAQQNHSSKTITYLRQCACFRLCARLALCPDLSQHSAICLSVGAGSQARLSKFPLLLLRIEFRLVLVLVLALLLDSRTTAGSVGATCLTDVRGSGGSGR